MDLQLFTVIKQRLDDGGDYRNSNLSLHKGWTS